MLLRAFGGRVGLGLRGKGGCGCSRRPWFLVLFYMFVGGAGDCVSKKYSGWQCGRNEVVRGAKFCLIHHLQVSQPPIQFK